MSLPVLVLSLADAAGRRQATGAELGRAGLGFRFFDAVDGRAMDEAALAAVYDGNANARRAKRPLTRGEVACALGHRAIWADIAAGDAPVALICEDDLHLAVPPAEFLAAVEAAGPALEELMIKIDGPAGKGASLGRLGGAELVLTSRLPARTTGYLLGRRAAQRLLSQAGPVARPVDLDLKHYWEHGVPVLVTRPQFITERVGSVSTLSPARADNRKTPAAVRLGRNLRYQIAMSWGRLRHPPRPEALPQLDALRGLLAR